MHDVVSDRWCRLAYTKNYHWHKYLELQLYSHIGNLELAGNKLKLYSYFEKGCRKKYTRQSWKALWVVLSSLFFREIWKNGTKGHEMCLRVLMERNKSRFDSYSRQEQCIDHILYYLLGLSRAHFFRQPFLKQLYSTRWMCQDLVLEETSCLSIPIIKHFL